ncbi:MAG: tRNA (adenosine(37)-N6)-dimethylallyltransferase MiaA [Proteobacteria bacterium]|nr:tRNA (adenosine(37)-N6)-dimethylallyltransferase MiaA [Pseudomonadota bacterium]
MEQTALVVTGPTGSGKSGLALALAEKLRGTVINADSMQVYNLYPRLTAQPDEAEKKRVPHALYSSVSPPEKSTADNWAQQAAETIRETFKQNRLPILTGGTGLYLEFLMHGRSDIPDVPEDFVQQAKEDFEKLGGAAVIEKLREIDPASATLKPGDRARVVRAWSVYLATGRSLGQWQKESFQPPKQDWNYKTIFLLPERQQLYSNINARFLKMIEQGALDEVKAALARNVPADHPAHKAHGARELQDVIEKRWGLDQAISRAQQLTRNYAKRQFTWFKNRFMKKEKESGRAFLSLEGADFSENLAQSVTFLS